MRMLSNSAFAGLLAAAYLTLLLLSLNPSVPVEAASVWRLLAVMTVTYGVHIAFASYALYVLRQIVLAEPSSPGWISLRLLTWTAAALSGTAAVMTWLHASGLRNALDPRALPALAQAGLLFSTAMAVFLCLAVARAVSRQRRQTVTAILFTFATAASIAAPLILRRAAIDEVAPHYASVASADSLRRGNSRVFLMCLDGASLDVISLAVASGRLPNFSRVLDRGASLHLVTSRPTQAEPAWASAMTGKWPSSHGIRGAVRYRAYSGGPALEILPDYVFSQGLVRFGFFAEEPYTGASLRARPLWRLLGTQNLRSGIIGLPLTYPAEPLSGFVVSDAFTRVTDRATELGAQAAVYPPELADAARNVLLEDEGQEISPRVRLDPAVLPFESAGVFAADRARHRLAMRLGPAEDVRMLAVRYTGIDVVGHYYLRFAQRDAFRDVSEEERLAHGRVLDDYYAYLDSLVGEALTALREGDVLLIVSAFGMEPLPFGKRLLERLAGDARFSGTHERAPDGFAMAYGDPVRAGRLARGAIVDIVPTLLYFFGLPVGRDMHGFARTDMFTGAFNEPRTIAFIPTYEPLR